MGAGLAALADVWAMLDDCAAGNTKHDHDHSWCIRWRGLTYPDLPLGQHGRGRTTGRAEIQLGHVRQLARQFGIEECAGQHFPSIAPRSRREHDAAEPDPPLT